MPRKKNEVQGPFILDGMLWYDSTTQARASLSKINEDAQRGLISAVRFPGGKHLVMMSLTRYRGMLAAPPSEGKSFLTELMPEVGPRNTGQSNPALHAEAEERLPQEVEAEEAAHSQPVNRQAELAAAFEIPPDDDEVYMSQEEIEEMMQGWPEEQDND